MKIINAEGLILGRLASVAAKAALLGEEIVIINCEKVIISGKKENIREHEKQKWDRIGYPFKSPKYSRMPDRIVRRTIRRMLPFKFARGKEAFKRVMCYVGIPSEFAGKETMNLKKQSAEHLPTLKYATLSEVCKSLGGKV